MVEVKWSDYASNDLDDIAAYIATDSLQYAGIIINNLINAVAILEQHPFAGRMVPEYSNKNIRELIRGNYRIIYKVSDKEHIRIVTVCHSARLLPYLPDIK
jgi:addiction module RelE/StbE family toxin